MARFAEIKLSATGRGMNSMLLLNYLRGCRAIRFGFVKITLDSPEIRGDAMLICVNQRVDTNE